MKKSKVLILASAMTMLLATTAYAATTSFSGTLPANQGDTEISTVGRLNDSTTMKYFTIKITSMKAGYTSARAWTESSLGSNYSDPYTEAQLNTSANINYTSVPGKGANVVLNLDNPVYTSDQVSVAGTWSPN